MNLSGIEPSYYFFNGTIVFLSNTIDNDFHRHHVLQISTGIDNPFILETEKSLKKVPSVIIDTNINHRFDCMDNWHLTLLIDPEHGSVEHIRKKFLLDDTAEPDFDLLKPYVDNIVQLLIQNGSCDMVKESLNNLLTELTGFEEKKHETDQRILKIFKFIENLEEKKVSMEALTDLVNLSESRLSHLFKDHTGIPVRRYIL